MMNTVKLLIKVQELRYRAPLEKREKNWFEEQTTLLLVKEKYGETARYPVRLKFRIWPQSAIAIVSFLSWLMLKMSKTSKHVYILGSVQT